MKRSWKLTLEYDGSRYSGWQEQQNARTVAGELRKAISSIVPSPFEFQGAGRTDAGVHARGQVAHLRYDEPEGRITGSRLRDALNLELPADIVVLAVEAVSHSFHARHDAAGRTYTYQISRRKTAFAKKYVWWVKEELDTAAMAQTARMIEGRHNFTQFCAEDPSKPHESPFVVVTSSRIEEDESGLLLYRIEASHFLWRMVRRLTGALVRIGTGELRAVQFEKLLTGRGDPRIDIAAWTAPASGLFLERVRY